MATSERPVLPPLANKPSTPSYPYNRPAAARAVRSRVGQCDGHLPASLPPSRRAGPAGYHPEASSALGLAAVDNLARLDLTGGDTPPLPPSPPTSPPAEDSFASLTGEEAPPPRYAYIYIRHTYMHVLNI